MTREANLPSAHYFIQSSASLYSGLAHSYSLLYRKSILLYASRSRITIMAFSGTKAVLALVATTVLSYASLSLGGYPRGAGYHRRSLHAGYDYPDIHAKRADAGSIELPLGQIQMLQSEYSAFKSWITDSFNNSASTSIITYIAQLK